MTERKKTNTKKMGRPVGSTKKKMTKGETQELKEIGITLILNEHYSWRQFVEFVKKKYGVSEQMGTKYWNDIWVDIREKFELEKDKLITKHLQKYWDIHDEALVKGDLNTARQVLNDIAKVQGLNEPEKLDINTTGEITFKFGDEE